MKKLLFIVLLMMLPLSAQKARPIVLYTFVSDGLNNQNAAGAQDNAKDLNNAFKKALMSDIKSDNLISPVNNNFSFMDLFANLNSKLEASDNLMTMFVGAWEKNDKYPEFATFNSNASKNISADYLINYLLLCRSEQVIFFVVSPYQAIFPDLGFSTKLTDLQNSGKFIVSVESRNPDFDAVLSNLIDCLEDVADDVKTNLEEKGNLQIHEWLKIFQARANARQIDLKLYPVLTNDPVNLPTGVK